MRLLIIGGTGFIGTYVVREALKRGYEVFVLKRSENSKFVVDFNEKITGKIKSLIYPFSEVNASTLKEYSFDAIINLAAAGVSPKKVSWEELIDINIKFSLKIAKIASELGIKRLVVAGTSHEYGESANKFNRIPPNAPLEPLNSYGSSKAAGYHILKSFAIEKKIELFYARIFCVYGVGQFKNNFWPSLYEAAISGKDFSMTAGLQVTDFLKVESAAFYLLEGASRKDIKKGKPLVVNIGSGVARSLREFAQSEWNKYSINGKLYLGDIPYRGDVMMRCVPSLIDIEKKHP